MLTNGNKRCKIIMLDCRYHRDLPEVKGTEGTILGATQWQWLEHEMAQADSDFLIIVSGIQVLPTQQPYEKWDQFPHERARLLALLDDAPQQNIVLISGDRHIAEFSHERLPSGKDLYELTASGLTNAWKTFPGEINTRRIGPTFHHANHAGLLIIDWQQQRFTGQICADSGEIGLAFTTSMASPPVQR